MIEDLEHVLHVLPDAPEPHPRSQGQGQATATATPNGKAFRTGCPRAPGDTTERL